MLNTMELSSIRSRKAPQEIVYRIRGQILAGLLERGSKLPSEQELMHTFNVSRQTLREALRVLEVQGLLEIRAGSGGGAFVAEVDLETAQMGLINFFHDKDLFIQHLTATRTLLEPYLAEQAALNRTDEDLETLETIHKNCQDALRDSELKKVYKYEIRFHTAVANAAKNPLLILIENFTSSVLLDTKHLLKPDVNFSVHVLDAHEKLIGAIRNRQPEEAREIMLAHVRTVGIFLEQLADTPLKWR